MKNLNLLYVEDDEEALEDIEFLLGRSFSNIYTAIDGNEGLYLFNQKDIDIVLLDINIPKINGLEVAERIRKSNEHIPIIFISAHSETQKLLSAINMGAISYIIKPFDIEELKEAILKAISIVTKNKDINQVALLNNDFYWDNYKTELTYNSININLTKNEIVIIKHLYNNKNMFYSAEELKEVIFIKKQVEANSIVQMLSRLKNKIHKKTKSDNFFIDNIYGKGYCIKI